MEKILYGDLKYVWQEVCWTKGELAVTEGKKLSLVFCKLLLYFVNKEMNDLFPWY